MEKDWVILRIDEFRMWVSLTIKEPEGEEASFFSADFIEGYLRENGIKSGIIKEAVEALSEQVQYGREVVVARGKEPVNGRDGMYNFTVALEDVHAKPVVNEDGSVDYYNSLNLAMVKAGDLIAVYEPATPGEYGYTVFAEMLPPVKGKELRPLRGKGLCVSEDGLRYTAEYDGRIYKNGNNIIIDRVYTVKGDLDIEKGNIRFNGDVEVRGDVRSGLTIEADGNVYINGHVGGCRIIAGGNVTVKKGIQGRYKCYIEAGGDVACSFIERCEIITKGNVYADSILDSNIYSHKQIIVNSKSGQVIGGTISAIQGIMVKESGNKSGTVTVLRAGVDQDMYRRAKELLEKHQKCKEDVKLFDKHLKACDSIEGSKRTPKTEQTRMKIVQAKVIRSSEMKKISEELECLNKQIELAKSEARVKITGIANISTKINIEKQWYMVNQPVKDVEFRLSGGFVKMYAGDDSSQELIG